MNNKIIARVVILIYAVCAVVLQFHHELWADEMQHFLLARDSNSLWELYRNCRYEGHPLLWNFLLYVLTRFSQDPVYMQILQLLISTSTTFILLKYTPFEWTVKLLLVFGYFNLFEYGTLNRNYELAFLLLLIYGLVRQNPRFTNQGYRLTILFLLANVHLFGIFAAFAFYLFDQAETVTTLRGYRFRLKSIYFPLLLLMIVWVFVVPGKGHMLIEVYNQDPFFSLTRLKKVFFIPLKAFLHVPDIAHPNLWNRNLFIERVPILAALLNIACWVLPFKLLERDKKALLVYGFVLITISIFAYVSPLMVSPRHCGFLFILLIVLMFIRNQYLRPDKASRIILIAILCIQFASAITMAMTDIKRPFSNGRNVAEYIAEEYRDAAPVLISNMGSGSPVAGYGKTTLIYAEDEKPGSFARWETRPFILDPDTLQKRIIRHYKKYGSHWLVLNEPYQVSETPGIKLLAKFEGAVVGSENYRVYAITGNE